MVRRGKRRLVRLSAVFGAVIGLCGVAPKPADAQISLGINVPFFSFGFATPAYYPYYPYYGYGYGYYRPYYRVHYRHHHSWCHYHPYRCHRHWR